MRIILTLFFSLCVFISVTATCFADSSTAKEGSVEWYRLPENKNALEAKLAECAQKSRDAQQADDMCRNAKRADFLGGPYEKVKEPTFGF